jgi:hypothetical protein
VPRKCRTICLEPTALGGRHGFPAQRIFSYEAGPLQLVFYQIQLSERRLELYMSSRNLLRYGNQKAQAILYVLQFCMVEQPGPI